MKKISDRSAEDVKRQVDRAKRAVTQRQTDEWKENEGKVRAEVQDQVEGRPDISADTWLRDNEIKFDPGRLTLEAKAELPKEFVGKEGVAPDDLAGFFGYQTGEALVNRLRMLEQQRKSLRLTPEEYIKRAVDEGTERQMQKRFGNLEENILREAEEHASSETQMDLLHEETLASGMKAGSALPFTKADFKKWAKTNFDNMKVGDINRQKFLDAAGKAGRNAEMALLHDDPADAFRQKQAQYMSMLYAQLAIKHEKVLAAFERTAKQFSKREVPSVLPEYTNFVHEILMKVGQQVRRSVQDLDAAIGHSGFKDLESFVDTKQAELRELPVAEFLYDPAFRKPLEQLTSVEFQAVNDSIKALIKNGRDELKINKAGEAHDLATVKAQMIEQLSTLGEKKIPLEVGAVGKGILFGKRMWAGLLQLETIFDRWDKGDPRGVFTQYIMRPFAEAGNYYSALGKKYARQIRELSKYDMNLNEKIDNPLFIEPLSKTVDNPGGIPMNMTRGKLRAILQNVGNASNLDKLARGYDVKPEVIMQWLEKNATKDDWDWAQAQGDIFASIKKEADVMARSLSGVAAENIDIQPIILADGSYYRGWYFPIIYDAIREGTSKKTMGGSVGIEPEGYVKATTPRGYTKARTGYAAPLDLSLDQTASLMARMLRDIAFRPSIIEASKLFYDKDLRAAITKYYGVQYRDLLVPYLRDVAGMHGYSSTLARVADTYLEYVRQNIIGTLIGWNPGTVMKHGPTAAMNSITEVGPVNFLKAVKSLIQVDEVTGERNWTFAMKTSEELQRRHQNWFETLGGAQDIVLGKSTLRQTLLRLGSSPVSWSDLLSAVPTWLAQYEKVMNETGVHGDAVFMADRAVRRAHGSTAITSRPELVRSGPMGRMFTSLYGFFNHVLQRQFEMSWRAKEAFGKITEGEFKEAAKDVPRLGVMLFSYVVFPALIEEMVTPLTNDKRESWGKWGAMALIKGLSSSIPILRDITHSFLTGHDPSAGLFSTGYKAVSDLVKDLRREKPFSKQNAGNYLQHGAVAIGAATGWMAAQPGKTAKFIYNYATGQERPRGYGQWWHGIRYGTAKERK